MAVVLFYVLIAVGVQTILDLLERKALLGLLLFELALVLILTVGISISTLIETMHDFAKLAGQIKVFRVQESECFCCSNNHRHPHTGQLMQCDRDQIYQKIQKLEPSRVFCCLFTQWEILRKSIMTGIWFDNFFVALSWCTSHLSEYIYIYIDIDTVYIYIYIYISHVYNYPGV